ncbi:unnamed protein product [Rangifer tarandus platyrhynchus]|uniref:Uncharacterized protein n=1 Tax=Rangifer tarandus platyrhynchus TaxID=3082113 RepID=A0AC59Y2Z5_RANTA
MEYYCAPQLLSLHSRACKLPLLSPFSLDPMLHNSAAKSKTKGATTTNTTQWTRIKPSPPEKELRTIFSCNGQNDFNTAAKIIQRRKEEVFVFCFLTNFTKKSVHPQAKELN